MRDKTGSYNMRKLVLLTAAAALVVVMGFGGTAQAVDLSLDLEGY